MKHSNGPSVDPLSLTAAGEWCIFDRPSIGTGAGRLSGRNSIFRKQTADTVAARDFDAEAKRRFPDMDIVLVRHSFGELVGIRARLLADAAYWGMQGLRVTESTIRIAPDLGALVLDEVAEDLLLVADKNLRDRYGQDAVRPSSNGPAHSTWTEGAPRIKYRTRPL